MAVTKIHPIKVNLKAALDYIENPDKTDDKMLVSSFGCSYETADIEFQMLLAQAFNKGNNLAHHLIQAFEPGETTPEQAHEIGRQLANEVLQGKYPYVLTTHIDKGHLHNHIIFCAVDMVQQRKYISNRRSYAYIRRTSDRLCRENGLSVVKPGKDKGKSYAEWDAQRKGKSWKAKLKIAIDAAIPQAKDFDDFLRLMQAQGYEIKQGKFTSFRAPGQERFTRCKTLGEDYTEEAITRRIKGLAVDRGPKRKTTKEITLRIDLENSIKAQQSAGYAKWAKVHNLKQAARTLNFLTEHGIDDYAALENKVAEISAVNDEAAAALKAVERRLSDMAVLIKNISTYRQTRPVALEYRKAKDKAAYRREHGRVPEINGPIFSDASTAKILQPCDFGPNASVTANNGVIEVVVIVDGVEKTVNYGADILAALGASSTGLWYRVNADGTRSLVKEGEAFASLQGETYTSQVLLPTPKIEIDYRNESWSVTLTEEEVPEGVDVTAMDVNFALSGEEYVAYASMPGLSGSWGLDLFGGIWGITFPTDKDITLEVFYSFAVTDANGNETDVAYGEWVEWVIPARPDINVDTVYPGYNEMTVTFDTEPYNVYLQSVKEPEKYFYDEDDGVVDLSLIHISTAF